MYYWILYHWPPSHRSLFVTELALRNTGSPSLTGLAQARIATLVPFSSAFFPPLFLALGTALSFEVPAYEGFSSIEDVCGHMLSTNTVISESYYVCPNGHRIHHSNSYDAFLSAGVHVDESIAQWVSTETHHANARCQICACAVGVKLRFCHSPPLLVFSISQLNFPIDTTFQILIENSFHVYTLTAVIYYANSHFTTQIITRDGSRIWGYT